MGGDQELKLRYLLDIQVELSNSSCIYDSGIKGKCQGWI